MSEPTPTPEACPPDGDLACFFEGQLAPERSRGIAVHLAVCAECRVWVAGMRDAGAEKEKARRRFGTWTLVALLSGLALIVALVLVVLASDEASRLAGERPDVAASPGKLFRVHPVRAVVPGGVFPSFRRGESVRLERLTAKPALSLLYLLDPGKGMRRLKNENGGALEAPLHRGLVVYLALDFAQAPAENELAAFEKAADDFVRKSQPLIVLGNMGSGIAGRGWTHQMIPIEWED